MCNSYSRWNRGQACANTQYYTHTRLAYTQQRLEVLASSVLPPIFSSTATDDRVLAASLFEWNDARAAQTVLNRMQAFLGMLSIIVLKLMPRHNSLEADASSMARYRHCVLVHNVNAHFKVRVTFPSFFVMHFEWPNRDASTFKTSSPILCSYGWPCCGNFQNKESDNTWDWKRFFVLFCTCLAIAICLPAYPTSRRRI